MNPTPRKMTDEDNALIQDYLNKGGKIEVKTPGARTEDIQYTGGFYQRRKKKAQEGKEDV
tara:strand:- start:5765 stop:5944 length:180 start_codon:yes stop_codon:yes gene_type:complete